jgi:hypothetical protein
VTGNPNSPSPSIAEWFNTTAFSEPVDSNGNSPRNFLRGPKYVNLDSALIKSFPIPYGPFDKTQKIDFRFEVFNLFNHPNLGQPGNNLAAGTLFGQITSAQSPRVLQAALKFIF